MIRKHQFLALFVVPLWCPASFAGSPTYLSCEGYYIFHRYARCKGTTEIFTVKIDDSKISWEPTRCLRILPFSTLPQTARSELRRQYEKLWNGAKGERWFQDFGINIASGEFGAGLENLNSIALAEFAVGGTCKKVKPLLDN